LIPSNGEVTFEWLGQTVNGCRKLMDGLASLRSCVEKMVTAFKDKGAFVTLRFVAELREIDEIKTPKCQRDLKPLDLERFARLAAMLRKKHRNVLSIMDCWRECCRGPDGLDWLALGAVVLRAAVGRAFKGMGK
jgi:hypothetical protein